MNKNHQSYISQTKIFMETNRNLASRVSKWMMTLFLMSVMALVSSFNNVYAKQTFPYKTTTIKDGKFAADTEWYLLFYGNNGKLMEVDGDKIVLGYRAFDRSEINEKTLWAFVEQDGELLIYP